VSEKVNVATPEDQVASTGPATTEPFSSTIDALVIRPTEAEVVAYVTVIAETETASPVKFVMKPPNGWLLTPGAMFCAGTSVALPIVVAEPALIVVVYASNHGVYEPEGKIP
jgi:hypothetical protein